MPVVFLKMFTVDTGSQNANKFESTAHNIHRTNTLYIVKNKLDFWFFLKNKKTDLLVQNHLPVKLNEPVD